MPEPSLESTVTDLVGFLELIDAAVMDALKKRKGTLADLAAQGYGDVTVQLTFQKERIVMAEVVVGVKDKRA